MDTTSFLQQLQNEVNTSLEEHAWSWPDFRSSRLGQAMSYSLFAGGKRLRPVLTLLACEACDKDYRNALKAACALEFIHTYSLIHDDLPAMDNDDLRRGKPTCHKIYGEASAILAGDGMLTFAFEILAQATPDPAKNLDLVKLLSQAAGIRGMVGGQQKDLEAERATDLGANELESIHRKKTGALISAALEAGGIVAGAHKDQLTSLRHFGYAIGLAFQIQDDILDCTGSAEEIGKSPGKDLSAKKLTYPALLGLEEAQKQAALLIQKAQSQLSALPYTDKLHALSNFIIARRS